MNILRYSTSLIILLKYVIIDERNVKGDVVKAVEENGFEGIRRNWKKWWNRKDLFDYVVTKDVEFIIGFINQVDSAKKPTLAALFIKRPDDVDEILKKINHSDDDLVYLTRYRPELAESHAKFFRVIDMINDPKNQKGAVQWGVFNLLKAEKHPSVIPLINTLENRQFNGRSLRKAAIREAFHEGAWESISHIVEEFYEHPAITHWYYARVLIESWKHDKSKKTVFQFLLTHADQGDLGKVKDDECGKVQEFRDAIGKAMETAPPVGIRHLRFFGRVKIAIYTLNDVMITEVWMHEPGSIIAAYLLGEQEGRKARKKMVQ